MSLGFGFGLPHHVAILGGGGPPATVYFLSITSSSTAGVTLTPITISVDGSGNSIVFGRRTGGLPEQNGFALKITSSGAFSLENRSTLNSLAAYGGPVDASGNYYISGQFYSYSCLCGIYYYPELLKLDSSFNKLAGLSANLFNGDAFNSTIAKDSSGSVWMGVSDSYAYFNILKFNAAITTVAGYSTPTVLAGGHGFFNSMAADSAGALVLAGERYFYWWDCSGCYYWYYPVIQSVSATTPTTNNWVKEMVTAPLTYGFGSVAVDSSNNVYTNLKNTLFKFNSSGTLQWQYTFTGIADITSIAFDSSGNVYCIGLNISGVLLIIKTNSSGTIQYSRTLAPATNAFYQEQNWYNNQIVVQGSTMYITVGYLVSGVVKSVVFKVPTDGSLTQSISVGGYSFTYAAGSVTQSTAAYTFSTPTGYDLISMSPFSTFSPSDSMTADGATTAVAIL